MSANTSKTKTKTTSCFPSLSGCLRGLSARFARIFRKDKKKAEFRDDDADTGSEPDFESCDDALTYYDCCEIMSASPDKEEEKPEVLLDKTSPICKFTREDTNHSETVKHEKESGIHHSGVDGSTIHPTNSRESGDLNYGLVESSSSAPEKAGLERRSESILCRTSQNLGRHDKSYHETIFSHASEPVLKKARASYDDRPADELVSSETPKNRSLDAPRSLSAPNLRSTEDFQLTRKLCSHEKISRGRYEKEISEKQENVKQGESFTGFTSNSTLKNTKMKLEDDLEAEEMHWKKSNYIGSSVCSASCPTFECNKVARIIRKTKSQSNTTGSIIETDAISTRGSSSIISTCSIDSERNFLLEFDIHLAELQRSQIDEQNFWSMEESSSSIPSSPEKTHQNTSPKSISSESVKSPMLDGKHLQDFWKNSQSSVSSSSSMGSQWSSSSECSQVTGSGGAVKKKKKAMKVPRFVIRETLSEDTKKKSTAIFSEAAAREVNDKDGNPLNEVTPSESARPNTEMADSPLGQSILLAPPARHPHPRKDRQVYRKAGNMDGFSTATETTTVEHVVEANLSSPLPSPVRQHCLLRPADIGVSKYSSSAPRERHQAYFWEDEIQNQLSFANFDDMQFGQVTKPQTLVSQVRAESIEKLIGISALELSNQDNFMNQVLEETYKYKADGKRSESCPVNSTATTSGLCTSYLSLPDIQAERRIRASELSSG